MYALVWNCFVKILLHCASVNYVIAEIRLRTKMDDGLQDLQADSLRKEIEKLRETVGSSAARIDDSDAITSEDEGALHVYTGDYGGSLSERDGARSHGGKIGI